MDTRITTWRKAIESALAEQGETFQDIIHCTLSDAELDVEFYCGYGSEEGDPFTAWTEKNVYFPIGYDGAEWVGHAPRHPCDIAMRHQGGG